MSGVRVQIHKEALRSLRYSPEVVRILEHYGKILTDRCNAELKANHLKTGFEMTSQPGVPRPSGRHRVNVAALGVYARRHDARHNTLIRHLGGL